LLLQLSDQLLLGLHGGLKRLKFLLQSDYCLLEVTFQGLP
jgi:hypothetical protein